MQTNNIRQCNQRQRNTLLQGRDIMKNKLTKEDIIYRKKLNLKNMERKYAKLIQHSDMMEECIELKAEIDSLKRELQQ